VQGGYGACFCRHGTSFIECWSDRGTILISGRVFSPVDEVAKGHWRSIAPKALTEAEGERHGVQTVTEPEFCHGAGF